jgi:hypothetical protein
MVEFIDAEEHAITIQNRLHMVEFIYGKEQTVTMQKSVYLMELRYYNTDIDNTDIVMYG